MCQAIIQWRDDGKFDLSIRYCRPPTNPTGYSLEQIGTAMSDRTLAEKRAQDKYDGHDCAKRFGCTLTFVEQPVKVVVKEELGFFDIAFKNQKP